MEKKKAIPKLKIRDGIPILDEYPLFTATEVSLDYGVDKRPGELTVKLWVDVENLEG